MEIWSLNLSWATQLNLEQGSERRFVRRCKKASGQTAPTLIPSEPSECTKTALRAVAAAQPDIVCFQELASVQHAAEFARIFFPTYRSAISSVPISKDTAAVLLTLYSDQIRPHLAVLTRDLGRGRPCQVVVFPDNNVLVNVHMPRDSNLRRFTGTVQDLLANQLVRRILICGDFNQAKPKFALFGFAFGGEGRVATCCFDSSSWRPGDYVFDSDNLALQVDVPADWPDPDQTPTSDHLPVRASVARFADRRRQQVPPFLSSTHPEYFQRLLRHQVLSTQLASLELEDVVATATAKPGQVARVARKSLGLGIAEWPAASNTACLFLRSMLRHYGAESQLYSAWDVPGSSEPEFKENVVFAFFPVFDRSDLATLPLTTKLYEKPRLAFEASRKALPGVLGVAQIRYQDQHSSSERCARQSRQGAWQCRELECCIPRFVVATTPFSMQAVVRVAEFAQDIATVQSELDALDLKIASELYATVSAGEESTPDNVDAHVEHLQNTGSLRASTVLEHEFLSSLVSSHGSQLHLSASWRVTGFKVPKGSPADLMVFHGTAHILAVIEGGFNCQQAKRCLYGRGLYFTENAAVAKGYAGRGKLKYLVVARLVPWSDLACIQREQVSGHWICRDGQCCEPAYLVSYSQDR